eukprot:5230978-Pyramimonas_sp.AAC.1
MLLPWPYPLRQLAAAASVDKRRGQSRRDPGERSQAEAAKGGEEGPDRAPPEPKQLTGVPVRPPRQQCQKGPGDPLRRQETREEEGERRRH